MDRSDALEAGAVTGSTDADADVARLIHTLGSYDGLARQRARRQLEEMGRRAVPALIRVLPAGSETARWEAAHALKQIRDPASAEALARAMEDERFEVRWAAAEAEMCLGRAGLRAVLEALVHRSGSVLLRQAAYHALHGLHDANLQETLGPVLGALRDVEPAVGVPGTALTALDRLAHRAGSRRE